MFALTAGLVPFTLHAFAVCVFWAVLHQIFVNPFAGVISGHVTVHVHQHDPLYTVLGVHVLHVFAHPFPFTLNVTVIALYSFFVCA